MATTLKEQNKEYLPHAWENVKCPFCEQENTRHHEYFGPSNRFEYVQCKNCDLVYLNPRPKYDEKYLSIAYDVYGSECHHVINNGELSKEERQNVEKDKIQIQKIEKLLGRKGKILDIGCATGLFLLAAKEEGWEVNGIDISAPMIEFMNNTFNIKGFAGQYNEIDLSSSPDGLNYGPYDVIYCSHVIEHIPNPIEWMKKFKKDLKPDGLLYIQIPNQYSFGRVIQRFLKTIKLRKGKWQIWRTPDHLFEPHIKSFKYLVHHCRCDCGYEILDLHTYSRNEKDSFKDRIFHKTLKLGSNIRAILKVE